MSERFSNLPLDESDGLLLQDIKNLNVSELTPLTPEVMSRQATINIGTIGHVAHGKSTVVRAISGVKTTRFREESVRNITIHLGYANAKLYKGIGAKRPACYVSRSSKHPDVFEKDGVTYVLQRHLSFVDCPGHDILMATMLNGAAVMDAALLLIAANEDCPQPQTSEHLAAVKIMDQKNIIILQNKIDLIQPQQAAQQYEQIDSFVRGHLKNPLIIPISAQLKINIDVLCEALCNFVPIPKRVFDCPAQLIVIRSFDVNKPGSTVDELQGGVAGGTLDKGVLRVGQEIEVRPGIIKKREGVLTVTSVFSQIVSMHTEKNKLEYAVPGGLIGVGTKIDPVQTRGDRLIGQLLGEVGKLPAVLIEIEIKYFLLRRLLGVKRVQKSKATKVQRLAKGDMLLVNIASSSCGAKVTHVKKNESAKLQLMKPVCAEIGAKLALSRRVDKTWRLVGWGTVSAGVECARH